MLENSLTDLATGAQLEVVFCKPVTCNCHYALSGHHSNELSGGCINVNYMLGHKRESSFLLLCVASILWILVIFWYWYVQCGIYYFKEDGLRLTFCARFSCPVSLDVGLKMRTAEINGRKSCVRNDATCRWILNECLKVWHKTSFTFQHDFRGHAVVWLMEALCYKPEVPGFDSRWGHWIFQLI
jgi:hypothetical protein